MTACRLRALMPATVRRLTTTAALLAAVLVAALAAAGPARAADPAPAAITVTAPDDAVVGKEITVSAQLTSNGQPVTSRLLNLLVDGVHLRNASVDANGRAEFRVRRGELATAHDAIVTVAYAGSSALAPASASVTVHVRPAHVVVETVPASDNVTLTLGSMKAVTKDGKAEFDVDKVGTYTLEMSTGSTIAPDTRADFVRWGDNVYTPKRSVKVTGDVVLQLGLHVAYRQSFSFTDGAGRPVDPASISSMTLTSTGGNELVLHQYNNVWLGAGTAVKRATGLEVSPRNWRVLEVEISGTNVVNRGQQAVKPQPGSTASVDVLLFDLAIEAHDALFGLPMTGSLALIYPDGTVRNASLDNQTDTVHFDRLPRGDYTLRLDTHGLGAPTPVALSRDQSAVIRVISYLDIGIFVAVLLIGLAALLWIGRRHQIMAAASRSQRVAFRTKSAARSGIVAAGGVMPSPHLPQVHLPAAHLPAVHLPAVRLPGLHLAARAPAKRARHELSQAPAAEPPPPRAPSLAEMLNGTIDHRPTRPRPLDYESAATKRSARPRAPGGHLTSRDKSRTSTWWRSCPACRRRVSPRAGYCPSCGAKVEA